MPNATSTTCIPVKVKMRIQAKLNLALVFINQITQYFSIPLHKLLYIVEWGFFQMNPKSPKCTHTSLDLKALNSNSFPKF